MLILAMLLGLSVPAPFFLGGDGDALTGQGNAFRQIAYLLVFGGAMIAAGVLRSPRRAFAIPPAILAVLAWCALSTTWAIEPGIAVRRLALTVMVVWSVFLLVREAGHDRTVGVWRILLAGVLVINYVAVIAAPTLGIHQPGEAVDLGLVGAWRGILGQKNYAGPVCALTILFFLFDRRGLRPAIAAAVIAAAAFFLWKTESKTSMGVLVVAIGAGIAFRLYRPRYRVAALHLIVLAVVGLATIGWVSRDALLAPFSREDSLTGRVQIWPVLVGYAAEHPWRGAGYGSFWNIGDASPVYHYTLGWVSKLASGHNGYLDLLVQIGVPGLLLVIFAVIIVPALQFITVRGLDRERGALLAALFVFVILHNGTESTLFDRDSALSVTLMTVIALLGLDRARARAITAAAAAEPIRIRSAPTRSTGR